MYYPLCDYWSLPQYDKIYLPIYTNDYPESYGRLESTMSIAVALIGKDNIILATDSRISSETSGGSGRTHDDGITKLWIMNGIPIAGVSNIAGYESQLIEDYKYKYKDTLGIIQTSETFAAFVRNEWGKATKTINPQVLMSSKYLIEFIMIGYQDKKPYIKRIFWDAIQQMLVLRNIEQHYYVAGMWAIADYWLKKLKPYLPHMDLELLKKLAGYLICQSTYFDSVGGDIQMITVDENEILNQLDQNDSAILEKSIRQTNISNILADFKSVMESNDTL